MVYEWQNKVVLITGAASGIGASVVKILLTEGVKHIAILDVSENAGIPLQNQLNKEFGDKVKFYNCDVTDESLLKRVFEDVRSEQGYIDVVINNAGIMNDRLNVYRKEIEVNVTATVCGTLSAFEMMRKDKGGRGGAIINIASIVALMQSPIMPIYFASKSAVLQFSNCIGMPQYYNRSGVRILCVCFGTTDTPLLSVQKIGSFDEEMETLFPRIMEKFPYQKVESAAQGLVEAFKLGESGSTWLASGDKPVKDISEAVKQAYKILMETFTK